MTTARKSSKRIGPKSPSSPIFGTSSGMGQLPCLLVDRPVNEQALRRPYREKEPGKHSGPKWPELYAICDQLGLSLSNPPETRGGKIKLRYLWRALAIVLPDLNERLLIVARLIRASECSLLPTPVASDSTRSPGSENRPRLKKSRGLRLQEELGARPGPEIVERIMGYPIGWTESRLSETPSSPNVVL